MIKKFLFFKGKRTENIYAAAFQENEFENRPKTFS